MNEQESYNLEQRSEILKGYIFKAIGIVEGRDIKDNQRSPLEKTKLTEFVKRAQEARENPGELANSALIEFLIQEAVTELDLSERYQ